MNWPKLLSTAQVELNELADAGLIKFIIPCKEKRKFVRRSIEAYFEKEGIAEWK